jgi:urea carboxylase
VEHIIFDSRLIHLPIAFEDSETKKSCCKVCQRGKAQCTQCDRTATTWKYIALCNGITVQEVKAKILGTEWYNSGCGFWPGGGFFWPMDPRCAIVVPKYNPPRTWTPEGHCGHRWAMYFHLHHRDRRRISALSAGPSPPFSSARGTRNSSMGPFLYRNGDRIRFHETTEEDILRIYP